MTSDGAEVRFWAYFDTTNQQRVLDDYAPSDATTTHRALLVKFNSDGTISAYTHRTGNPTATPRTPTPRWAPTRPAGPSTASSTTSRAPDLHAVQARERHRRLDTAQVHRLPPATTSRSGRQHRHAHPRHCCSRLLPARSLWLDDVRYSNTGITDPPVVDTTPPSAPASLLAVDHPADSGGSIDLSWAASTDNVGVTGYKLYRGTASGVYGTPVTLLTAATTYTDTTGVTGTRYYYAVAALDAAGNEGAKSPEATAVALDNTPPAVPSGLGAVGGTGQVDR